MRNSSRSYFFIFASIFALLSVPKSYGEGIKGFFIGCLTPFCETIAESKFFLLATPKSIVVEASPKMAKEIQNLQIENQSLKIENTRLQELFKHELYLISQLNSMQGGSKDITLQRHQENLKGLFQYKLEGVPAKVVYRSPASWNSSLWLNVGENYNQTIGAKAIQKNSPVIVGSSVIGVIDYVGKSQSRVRLITDSGLTISVRAARGKIQKHVIAENLAIFMGQLFSQPELMETPEERAQLIGSLEKIKKKLENSIDTQYLAKGELHGSSQPLWRSLGMRLKGIGFNYDFTDEEGPARDLRTGMPYKTKGEPLSIIQNKDLLITSGLDGIFPVGLHVAEVTHIQPLKEGDYYYELEAKPTAGNLDELSLVFVLPPVGYDNDDLPPMIGS